MALNRIFAGYEKNNRARAVASGTKSGDPVLSGGKPAVAITDRGDATKTVTLGPISITLKSGGVGLKPDHASLAFDGTYEFPVTGALSSTAQDTVVYITAAPALTLTAGSNTRYGTVDYPMDYTFVTGRLPVKIGG